MMQLNEVEKFENIHKFMVDDDRILLDVPSGSVHLIDELTWDLLTAGEACGSLALGGFRLRNKYSSDDISTALDEIEDLIYAGQLFSADDVVMPQQLPQTYLKSLCLNITHDCDLRCRYCFAGTGDYGHNRSKMPLEVATAAIDFLLEKSGPRPFCEVDFFGGEPLMNFDVVKATVEYGKAAAKAKNKTINFTLTTNAVQLSPAHIQWIQDAGLYNVVLSHDGRPEINDQMRITPNGKGSHDIINQHIKDFVQVRKDNYFIRGTYTANNLDFTKDIEHWLHEGYKLLSLEPVVAEPGSDASWAIKAEHLPAIKEEYGRLAHLYREKLEAGDKFQFFHFNIDLQHGPCLPKRLWGCGAGYEYMAVTPDGDLYPCHQFVGKEEFLLGNVTDGITNQELGPKFQNAHIYSKSACSSCWAKYHCSGGCHANAQAYNGDILKPYEMGCELEKMRLEYAIWLAVKALQDN